MVQSKCQQMYWFHPISQPHKPELTSFIFGTMFILLDRLLIRQPAMKIARPVISVILLGYINRNPDIKKVIRQTTDSFPTRYKYPSMEHAKMTAPTVAVVTVIATSPGDPIRIIVGSSTNIKGTMYFAEPSFMDKNPVRIGSDPAMAAAVIAASATGGVI